MLMESGILRVSCKANVMPIFAGKESIRQGQSDQGLHIFLPTQAKWWIILYVQLLRLSQCFCLFDLILNIQFNNLSVISGWEIKYDNDECVPY